MCELCIFLEITEKRAKHIFQVVLVIIVCLCLSSRLKRHGCIAGYNLISSIMVSFSFPVPVTHFRYALNTFNFPSRNANSRSNAQSNAMNRKLNSLNAKGRHPLFRADIETAQPSRSTPQIREGKAIGPKPYDRTGSFQ